MHLKQYEEVAAATTKEDLADRLLAFTHFVDFERFAVVLERRKPNGGIAYPNITNTPQAFQSVQRDAAIAAVDPVHTHLRTSFKPILYTQRTYVDANVADLWDLASPFGYAVGAAVSIAVPSIGRLFFGVDRSGSLPNDPEKVARIVSDLQLLTTYSQETMTRLLTAEDEPLTAQQLNVLQLICEGKSNPVIATLLDISENTVKFHVQGIFRRLNVSTREQAVLASCRLGLVS